MVSSESILEVLLATSSTPLQLCLKLMATPKASNCGAKGFRFFGLRDTFHPKTVNKSSAAVCEELAEAARSIWQKSFT